MANHVKRSMVRNPARRSRRGVAAVEFAAVAPVMFLMTFASIEFGRGMMAVQSLEEAARSACRVAVLRGATSEEINTEVDRILAPAQITDYTIQIGPENYASADRWSPVSVSIAASFNNMSWIPLPQYFQGKSYSATCTLPKEYSSGG